MNIVHSRITDERIRALLAEIIGSFHTVLPSKGLPLGNLTSQLLVNIYMNEFDQFVKHKLKVEYYLRYADDFIILSHDCELLAELVPKIQGFLLERLGLSLHPGKLHICKFNSGVDFLGWVHFPDHRILRTSTKRRAVRDVKHNSDNSSVLASYLGLMNHGNTYKLRESLKRKVNE